MKRPIREIGNFFKFLLGLNEKQDSLDSEIQFHIDEAIEERIAAGQNSEDARRETLREFGNLERAKEECRYSWGAHVLTNFIRDIAFAWRQLIAAKGYSIILILTFGFCIGLNTLVFSVYNSLYLNPDRYPDEDQVVRIYDELVGHDVSGNKRRGTSPILYLERKEQSEYIESIALYGIDHVNLKIGSEDIAEFLDVLIISPSMFDVLKIEPELGRRFYDHDTNLGARENIVILTHAWWQNNLNGNEHVVGTTMTIEGEPYEIVGVMPKGFIIPPGPARWDTASIGLMIPYAIQDWEREPDQRHLLFYGCYARMKKGTTAVELEEELAALNALNALEYPSLIEFEKEHPLKTRTMSVGEDQIRDIESTIYLALAISGFVLVIGALSIANFVLARNSYRIHELVTRESLGASRGRLFAQLITETGLVAIIGVALGIVVAFVGLNTLSELGIFSFFPMPPRLSIDRETILISLLLAGLMATICGLTSTLPVITQNALNRMRHEDSRTGSGSKLLKRYRGTLIFIQTTIAFALLVNGGLLARSFIEILNIDPGYDTEGVLFATVRPINSRYTPEERFTKMIEIENRVRALPEVELTGLTNWPPMKMDNIWKNWVVRSDRPNTRLATRCSTDTVSPGYFETLGVSVLSGRVFEQADLVSGAQVTVVDKAFADIWFPGEDPIGRQIALVLSQDAVSEGANLQWLSIIGVIEPLRINDLYTPSPGMAYTHVGIRSPYWFGLVIKARANPDATIKAMQELLLKIEPDLAIGQPLTMDSAIAKRYAERKNTLYLSLGLTATALGLTILGISGVISYSISAQKKEIGIRVALGANKKQVIKNGMKFWLRVSLAGMASGLVLSLALSGIVRRFLYKIDPLSSTTYSIAIILFIITITITTYAAARKTGMINPIEALKQ